MRASSSRKKYGKRYLFSSSKKPSSAQAPRAPVRAKPPPPTSSVKTTIFSRSTRVNNAVRSPRSLPRGTIPPLSKRASLWVFEIRQSLMSIKRFLCRSSVQQPLTRDSLTRSGFNEYKTIEEYNKVTFPG